VYLVKDPETCKTLVGVQWIDATIWFFFRCVSLNFWIIISFYVFSAREVYNKYRLREESEVSDSEERSFVNPSNKRLIESSLQESDDFTIPGLRKITSNSTLLISRSVSYKSLFLISLQ
jgi:hypothetical protein